MAFNIITIDNEIFFRLFSFQLRNNVNIGGNLAGYKFENIKIELVNKLNNNIIKKLEYNDINFGDDPSLLKSPFDIKISTDFYKNNEFFIRVTFENINNNIEWSEMNNKNTVIINLNI